MSPRLSPESIWRGIREARGREFLRTPQGACHYRELEALVSGLCDWFDRAGAVAGDRLLILAASEALAGAAFMAAFLDGLVPVMLSADTGPERFRAICAAVTPRVLVADARLADTIPDSAGQCLLAPESLRLERDRGALAGLWRGLRERRGDSAAAAALGLGQGRTPRLPPPDDTLAYLLFTSGTTAAPSGVKISRRAVLAQLETLARLFGYGPHSRIFNPTPLAHTDGLVQGLLLAVANQATLLRPGAFTLPGLETWLDTLVRFEATHVITNPTVLGLVHRFARHDDYFRDPRLFGVLSSASVLRPELWAGFEARFGCAVYNLYGMTETVANATYAGRHPEMGPVGTIGVPVDCELRLVSVDADGVAGEVADRGEIQVRGENVFQGYWNDPERTRRTLLDGGWMRTGDLGVRRPDGGYDIVGRIKTMINMGGQSVLPEEIDEALAAHPAVTDVATVGLPDDEFGEVAVAAVVLQVAASERELIGHCRQRLERLKLPKRIFVLDRIPRGDAGKPKTGELRALLQAMLADGEPPAAAEAQGRVAPQALFRLAAEVFQVPVEGLSMDSSPASVAAWDSFNTLNLMIEAELRFGVRIPAARVAGIRSLGDLYRAIESTR